MSWEVASTVILILLAFWGIYYHRRRDQRESGAAKPTPPPEPDVRVRAHFSEWQSFERSGHSIALQATNHGEATVKITGISLKGNPTMGSLIPDFRHPLRTSMLPATMNHGDQLHLFADQASIRWMRKGAGVGLVDSLGRTYWAPDDDVARLKSQIEEHLQRKESGS